VWSDSRTKTYAFEALSRPPRLGPRGQAGERADGIVLRWSVSPPSVPDLLPPADPR
jgi:hypothetical protein